MLLIYRNGIDDNRMSDITRILNAVSKGESEPEELLNAVYDELRSMAAAKMAREQPGQTLDSTALVHEAYLAFGDQDFESRRHFFGAASEAMRRILIDRARARKAEKRGGKMVQVGLNPGEIEQMVEDGERLERLNLALEHFEKSQPEKAELVKLRFFAGCTIQQSAEVLGISTATADRHWAYARAWLQNELNEDR